MRRAINLDGRKVGVPEAGAFPASGACPANQKRNGG